MRERIHCDRKGYGVSVRTLVRRVFLFSIHTLAIALSVSNAAAQSKISGAQFTRGEISDSAVVDPVAGRAFLVGVQLELLRLPQEGKRAGIVSKVLESRSNSNGWGIYLKRFATSVRPEIFWRGAEQGAMFTFERFDFRPRSKYVLFLCWDGGQALSAYVQELEGNPTRRARGVRGGTLRASVDVPIETNPRLTYLGSFPVAVQDLPRSGTPIALGRPLRKGVTFAGIIERAFVATPERLPGGADLEAFLDGGLEHVADKLAGADRKLWWKAGANGVSALADSGAGATAELERR